MTENVGDTGQVAVAKKRQKDKVLVEEEGLRVLVQDYGGRAFLWELLAYCGVYRTSYTGDAVETVHQEGRRAIGLWTLEKLMAVDDTAYILMQREANERGRQNKGKGKDNG